jgi:hypothetical protein
MYLPFDPGIVGRQQIELNRIGALSGVDGIISIVNQYLDAADIQRPRLTNTSKLVKRIYDWIHEAYDGRYDQAQDRYLDFRTTFFEVEELVRIAEHLHAE